METTIRCAQSVNVRQDVGVEPIVLHMGSRFIRWGLDLSADFV